MITHAQNVIVLQHYLNPAPIINSQESLISFLEEEIFSRNIGFISFDSLNEPRHWKTGFCVCKNKAQISYVVNAHLISTFVFATWIVQFILYPKFQDSSFLPWVYRLVCLHLT